MTEHAVVRCKERFGLALSRSEMAEIGKRCQRGEYALWHTRPMVGGITLSVFYVTVKGHRMGAAVNMDDGSVVTILDPKVDKQYRSSQTSASYVKQRLSGRERAGSRDERHKFEDDWA